MVNKYEHQGKKFKFETSFKLPPSLIIFLVSTDIQEINISATFIVNLKGALKMFILKK